MESVIFDGKEYTKASVLAEKFRYTADYLGQLCRGKKVDARLVGRAWYINLDSLLVHRDARYKTSELKNSSEITEKKAIHNYLSRIDVEPIIRRKTIRIVMNNKGAVTELPVKYEGDDQALIPRVQKNALSVSLPIRPADSERLKVHKNGSQSTNFAPEPLPEVSLSGKLVIVGIPEVTEEESEVIEEKALNKDMSVEPGVKVKPVAHIQPKVILVRPRTVFKTVYSRPGAPKATPEAVASSSAISFKPVSVVTDGKTPENTSQGFLFVFLSFVCALLVSLLCLLGTLETTIVGDNTQTNFVLKFENVMPLFR